MKALLDILIFSYYFRPNAQRPIHAWSYCGRPKHNRELVTMFAKLFENSNLPKAAKLSIMRMQIKAQSCKYPF